MKNLADGVPDAQETPGREHRLTHDEIVAGMRELRQRVKPGKMTVREMVNEGRDDKWDMRSDSSD